MQEVGEIMHLAGSGRVVVQLSREIGEGTVLCDSAGTRVARVMELIGPVRRPFASATPLTNNIKRHVGSHVFVAAPDGGAPGGGGSSSSSGRGRSKGGRKAAAARTAAATTANTANTTGRPAPARTKKTRRTNR